MSQQILYYLIDKTISNHRGSYFKMQPFYNYPNSMQPPISNPASSKALTKLKTGKFIQAEQMQFTSNIPMMTVPPPPRNIINFGPPPNNTFNIPSNVNFSPPHINHASSLPNMTLKRQGSNLSQHSRSQSSILTQSERMRQNGQTQINPQQGLNVSFQKNQNPQFMKPQSALQKTNHASSSGDLMRMRSSSASHFSLNQSQKRAANLESKIQEYHKQILQNNMNLNQKQRKITQLQIELTSLKQRSHELQLKLNENYQNQKLKDKKIEDLQSVNKEITSGRTGLQFEKNSKEEKIKNLQGTLQKMLKSKDIQIKSLNQSCTDLSKHLQSLHEKYQQQVRKLTQTIESQQETINHNKTYFDSLNDRMKSYQQHLSSREEEIKQFLKKMADQHSHIQLLQAENKTLKTDLSSHIQELQTIQQNINEEKNQKAMSEQQYQKLLNDYNNAKKLGQQQIQFLQNKVQEATLQKERLQQQIEMTKVVTLKRNMVFQRQVIYDLKRQNDQLWAKLIEKSQWNAGQEQKDPMYWSKRFSTNFNATTYNANTFNKYRAFQEPARPSLSPDQADFEQRYRKFVEDLQRQQDIASKKITQLNQKQVKNNQEYIQFYRNKCINLQKMVEQHLKINLSLKQQLQKYQLNSKFVDNNSTEVVFLKNQLQKQKILNQTLQRSMDLIKTQYQMRFKAAQARVDEIQNQNRNLAPNYNSLMNENLEQLKRLLAQSQVQIQRITNDNRSFSTQVSQGRKWQSMYEQIKRKYEQMSPITQYNKGSDSDELKNQLQNISRLLKQRQEEYRQLDRSQIKKCQSYEQQLRIKEEELHLMLKDFEKVERQFSSGRLRYDQLLKDIARLQKQLNVYKSGTTIVNSQMISYTNNLLRAKLLQIDAFTKQVKQHESRLNLQDDFSKEVANQIIDLVQNTERLIEDCLNHCSQIQANLKS